MRGSSTSAWLQDPRRSIACIATLLQIREVLRLAIRNHGTTIDWIYPGGWMQRQLRVYGRAGEPCRICGTPIEALRVTQRGTHVCPRCQPEPRRMNHKHAGT